MRVAVLICARNEELHIARCLSDWISGGCEVVLIDHDSDDRTAEIASRFLGHGLLSIERLPWEGVFRLREQLPLKEEIIRNITHEWVIHADADEWMTSPWQGISISEALRKVDTEGFTCVNFNEFVFVPWPQEDFTRGDYKQAMKTYYFFQPVHPYLMRAWRRDLGATHITSGGHLLDRGNLYPVDFVLRHYIVLSMDHACQKYIGRPFDRDELEVGWHVRRARIRKDHLILHPSPCLRVLKSWDMVEFDMSAPCPTHFWEWNTKA